MRLPDPEHSRVVLIGTSSYDDDKLPDLPAVGRGIEDLKQALTDSVYGLVPDNHCDVLEDEGDIRLIGRRLRRAANAAQDLLLVYFAGHGVIAGRRHELYLALRDTEWEEPEFNALEYDKLRSAVLNSPATTKMIILDCCFSGRVFGDTMSDPATEVIGQAAVDGSYVLASAARDQVSLILPGEDHTAFTGRLLRLIHKGLPDGPELLTIDDIYRQLWAQMKAEGLPEPQKRGSNNASLLAVARNRAFVVTATPLPPELQQAIENPLPSIKVAAVQELARILRGKHEGMALAARLALEQLTDDDSRTVAAAATAALGAPPSLSQPELLPSDAAVDPGRLTARAQGSETDRQAQEETKRQAREETERQAREGRALHRCRSVVPEVNKLEPQMEARSDAELRELTGAFRRRLADGETLDDLLPEAFATVREVAKRTLGQRHFDAQVMGGAAVHWGMVAEVKDGEGKTLVATLPAYLNALAGKGVHVVTVNDYLARRDAEMMGRVHRFLGLGVGVIAAQMSPEERRKSYAADITYGTTNEFGLDYLRDNMALSLDECVQRGHPYAIVDEADSILIDEAQTPLIISGPAERSARWYTEFAKIAPRLRRSSAPDAEDGDYQVDEKKRTVGVLESGVEKAEGWLGISNLYESVNAPLVSFLNNAIKAKEFYQRDQDYIVRADEILLLDKLTRQTLAGRRYPEGLHEAIQAKEGVPVQATQTLATVSVPSYFRMYTKLAGMTGSAKTEAAEFSSVYRLQVVEIPTNMPMVRIDQSDVVCQTAVAKFKACVDDIVERFQYGQPVLVGTTSVEKSESLSRLLKRHGIPHEVLNAKNHERDAAILRQAGRKGAVTVAINMALRGSDILLGGTPEFIADMELHQRGLSPAETPEDYENAWPEAVERAKRAVAEEREEVVALGGLYVLGTERQESRRLDNQLRGQSGRRGDPGESRFYLSLEDDLMRTFNSDKVANFMEWLKAAPEVPIESKAVSRSIRSAQTQVEQQNFEIRTDMLKYDDVLNRQRHVIYGERREVLEGADLHEQVRQMIDDVVTAYVATATSEGSPEEWDLDRLWTAFRFLYHPTLTIDDVIEEAGADRAGLSRDVLVGIIKKDAQKSYDKREQELTPEVMREVERRVVLIVLDRKWRQHLYKMNYLRESIGLRAMAHRDPLIEYQREGDDLFNSAMEGIKEESVGSLFNLQVEVTEDPVVEDAGRQAPGTGGPASGASSPPRQSARSGTPSGLGAWRAKLGWGTGQAGTAPPSPMGGARDEAGPALKAGPTGASSGDAPGLSRPQRPARPSYSAPTGDDETQAERRTERPRGSDFRNIGRNDLCPCGSGRKYKLCHGDPRNRTS